MFRAWRSVAAALIALAAALISAAPASAVPAVDGEFAIPGGVGTDNDIVEGPDGNMWVTTNDTNGLARITPGGVVTQYSLPNTSSGIAVGPDNNLWVSTALGVAKVSPADPENEEVFNAIGLTNGRGIVAGPDGRMWVAGAGELISFDPANPDGTEDETTITGLQPHGMSVGSDGLLWVADGGGTVYSATASSTPDVTPYDIRTGGAGAAQDVAAGPNGQVVYVNPGGSPQTVGFLPPGGAPQPIELGAEDPFGAVFGQDGAYWITRGNPNDLLRLTPDGQATTLSGFSPNAAMPGPRKIATGPNNTLWVTLDDQNAVARVTGVDPPGGAPETVIDKAPKKKLKAKDKENGKKGRARAKFKFSSTTDGAGFECSLRKKKKEPKFKGCESPAKYKLKPGKYEFQVRAVLAGVPDPSPDTFKFKVVRKRR